MDEGPSCPAAHRSGAATGTPSGDNHPEFRKAAIQSGRDSAGVLAALLPRADRCRGSKPCWLWAAAERANRREGFRQ